MSMITCDRRTDGYRDHWACVACIVHLRSIACILIDVIALSIQFRPLLLAIVHCRYRDHRRPMASAAIYPSVAVSLQYIGIIVILKQRPPSAIVCIKFVPTMCPKLVELFKMTKAMFRNYSGIRRTAETGYSD